MNRNVSALFINANGPYPDLVVDCWDEERDATKYDGDRPVVAHPPCARWCRWWYADGSDRPGLDGGLFRSALSSMTRCGGVIEHPAASHAWRFFDLPIPTQGAWVSSLFTPGIWTTEVAQRNYGHRARKLTWLLYAGIHPPPPLDWSPPEPPAAYITAPGRQEGGRGRQDVEIMSSLERELTPVPFAKLLISLAERARGP